MLPALNPLHCASSGVADHIQPCPSTLLGNLKLFTRTPRDWHKRSASDRHYLPTKKPTTAIKIVINIGVHHCQCFLSQSPTSLPILLQLYLL